MVAVSVPIAWGHYQMLEVRVSKKALDLVVGIQERATRRLRERRNHGKGAKERLVADLQAIDKMAVELWRELDPK